MSARSQLPIAPVIIGLMGAAALGLGVYGLFMGSAGAHPLFANRSASLALIAAGVILSVIEVVLFVRFARERQPGGGSADEQIPDTVQRTPR